MSNSRWRGLKHRNVNQSMIEMRHINTLKKQSNRNTLMSPELKSDELPYPAPNGGPSVRRVVGLILVALSALPAQAPADALPSTRRIDWTYTGVPGGIPDRTNICATFNPGASAAMINNAIGSCSGSGGGVVYLNAGTYNVTGIKVYDDNVTLRGAGADRTVLQGCNIVNLGSGFNSSSGINIIGGAKDSNTITVSSTEGLTVNSMIEIDRDDDSDVVVSTIGGSRHITQVNIIVAISGNTVTVRNPLIWDFGVGNPRIKWIFANTRLSGVEDLKLDHSGTSGCTNFMLQYCYGCWLKGVQSYKPSGYHITILGTLNGEIRDSYIADAQTYGSNNAGLAVYGNTRYGSNSSWKIENNIFNRVFPGVELQNSSSGFYVGYNYGHATTAASADGPVTWMFTDNHGPHDMMNLWEGNIGEMFGSDGYFGGSSHGTALRNHFTGYNPIFGTSDDPVRLNRLSYYYNLVGNVLGSANQRPPGPLRLSRLSDYYNLARSVLGLTNKAPLRYEENLDNCAGGSAIYRLGYPNIGNCGLTDITGHPVPGSMTYPDIKVASTLLRWGNYDYFNKTTRFVTSEIPSGVPVPPDEMIPNSYYYSVRPRWWPGGNAWPPIGPDVVAGNGDASGHVNKIPAQMCWEMLNLLAGG